MGTVGNAADGILHTGIDLFHLCLKVTGNIKGVLWRSRAQGGLGISDIAFYGNGGVIHKTYFCKGVGDRFLYEEVVGRQTQVGVVIRAKMPVRLFFLLPVIWADLKKDGQGFIYQKVNGNQRDQVPVADRAKKIGIRVITEDGVGIIDLV